MQPLKVTIVPVTPFAAELLDRRVHGDQPRRDRRSGRRCRAHPRGDRSAQGRAGEDPADARPHRSCGRRGRTRRGAVAADRGAGRARRVSARRTSKSTGRSASASRTCATSSRRAGWSKARPISIGDLTFSVLHVPGHTPGHLVFVNAPMRFALVGDTLFQGSVGRTDFPYGSHEQLIDGIKGKLLPLGDDVTILPGHGPASTIGAERRGNGFLQKLTRKLPRARQQSVNGPVSSESYQWMNFLHWDRTPCPAMRHPRSSRR